MEGYCCSQKVCGRCVFAEACGSENAVAMLTVEIDG